MALTLENATRSAICDAIVDLIDAGSAAGYLQIRQDATVLAELPLADPAFGAAANGVATLAGVPVEDSSADATGTANAYEFFDSDDNAVLGGAIGSPTCVLGTAARNAAVAARTALADGGTVDLCNGSTVLATFTLSNPAFGAPSNGAAVCADLPLETVGLAAAGGGTVANNYKVRASGGALLWSGTVGLSGSGADLILDNTSIAEDQPVAIESWTTGHPASGSGGLTLINTSITAGQAVEIATGTFTVPAS